MLDVTNPSAMQELIGSIEEQKPGYAVSLRVSGSGPKNLFAVTGGQTRRPARLAANIGGRRICNDPKNYLGAGDFDFVPTRLIDTMLMEAASDDWLVDFNRDGFAELVSGRLPVRTTGEAERMIAKIISYELSRPSEERLLVADRNDGYDFESVNHSGEIFASEDAIGNCKERRSLTDSCSA